MPDNDVTALWQQGVETLENAAKIMRDLGFDTGEIDFALISVDNKLQLISRVLAETDLVRYARVSRSLDRIAKKSGYDRGQHEVWIICPRAYAGDGMYVLKTPIRAPALFRIFDRYHDGEDLVHAAAPNQ